MRRFFMILELLWRLPEMEERLAELKKEHDNQRFDRMRAGAKLAEKGIARDEQIDGALGLLVIPGFTEIRASNRSSVTPR